MPKTSAPQLAWYLVHTKPRQETKALLNLEQQGYPCYLPLINIEKLRRGKVQRVSAPLFPRYLFIRLDNSEAGKSWGPIRSTFGVSALVQFGGQPTKVNDFLIEQLQTKQVARQTSTLFNPGESVRITDGPFAGLAAIYQCSDAEQRSLILLELMYKQAKMQIDTSLLEKSG